MNHLVYRTAFTLIEVLVVITVIATLVGLGFSAGTAAARRARITGSAALVSAVTATIASRQDRSLSVPRPGGMRHYQLWDVNRDGLLDGEPTVEQASLPPAERYPAEVLAIGYKGFIKTTGMSLSPSFIDRSGRVVDSWKHPLRIRWATEIYGANGFGVWSAGADGLDNGATGVGDDLLGWKIRND